MSNDNDWYMVQIWLDTNERSQAWLSRRLDIHEVSINRWKRAGKISEVGKLAICYVTGQTYEQLFN
jgi:hypothetical protein|tara:strand:- start:389 stop:586 length:198 start_codon:yes stop_codon:yes gene_type:complete